MGIKNGKIINFFRTIFEECHKNEVDQISKQNMKISHGQTAAAAAAAATAAKRQKVKADRLIYVKNSQAV